MKKVFKYLIGVIIIVAFIYCLGIMGEFENQYSIEMTVASVSNSTLILKDSHNENWSCPNTINAESGDTVNVIFSTNGTQTLADDEIIKIVKK